MSTDRELLQLAARAYWGSEIDDVCSIRWLEDDQAIGYTHGDNQDHNGQDREFVWNPLEDSAAALELAVKLDITIYPGQFKPSVMWWRRPELIEQEGLGEVNGDDRMATIRRLITRAAAEIGRAGGGG